MCFGARDLLYHFLDVQAVLAPADLAGILAAAKIDSVDNERVTDFLLYYGVLGIRSGDHDHYIFGVNYDLRQLKIRAGRIVDAHYIVNPAFWPGLSVQEPVARNALA